MLLFAHPVPHQTKVDEIRQTLYINILVNDIQIHFNINKKQFSLHRRAKKITCIRVKAMQNRSLREIREYMICLNKRVVFLMKKAKVGQIFVEETG